jgi:magnesium transporter
MSTPSPTPMPGRSRSVGARVRRFLGRQEDVPLPAAEMPRLSMPAPGTAAGIETDELTARESGTQAVRVTCVDYSPDQVLFEDVGDIPEFLARHRPDWSRVRWINIDGLSQLDVIRAFAVKYQLHPLAVEDVLHRVQTPKVEDYPGSADQPGRLFVVARAVEEREGRLRSDQVSFFLGRTTLLTFHDAHGEDVEAVRQRIRMPGSRLRQNDVSFLLYVLLDGIVDHLFPVLERYSERLEDVEEELLSRPSHETLQRIHAIKREMLLVRRAAWPLRELVAQLQRDKHECLSETAQTYLRDVYDHCVQIIDLVETYREIASGLAETYISVVSNRTNEIVKVLTVIGTIFIPLTFLAGVYGMNMPIPENASPFTYPLFWVVCAGVAGGMLLWFRRRGWL